MVENKRNTKIGELEEAEEQLFATRCSIVTISVHGHLSAKKVKLLSLKNLNGNHFELFGLVSVEVDQSNITLVQN